MENYKLPLLPPKANFESIKIFKQLANTNRALAELKGYSDTIPNKNILINAVTINEAKDSSAIENIITTHDELYKAMVQNDYNNPDAKEVVNYRAAIWHGYELIIKNHLLTTSMIIEIQQTCVLVASKTILNDLSQTDKDSYLPVYEQYNKIIDVCLEKCKDDNLTSELQLEYMYKAIEVEKLKDKKDTENKHFKRENLKTILGYVAKALGVLIATGITVEFFSRPNQGDELSELEVYDDESDSIYDIND